MDTSTANPLEVFRVLVSALGLIVDLALLLQSIQRQRALWRSEKQIGRGHIMARSNVWGAATIGVAHGVLLFVAYEAAGTPDTPGPITTLALQSNIGQVVVSAALTAWSALTMQAQSDADILDQRNATVESNVGLILDRIEDLFEQYAGRVIRAPKKETP